MLFELRTGCAVLLGLSAFAAPSLGQHSDVLLQEVNGRVWTGSANFDLFINEVGPRTFQAEFGSASSGFDCDGSTPYCIELPGFNTVSASNPSLVPPPGETADALTPSTDVEWDFTPVVVDGLVSNLMYWDGSGGVSFGPLPGPGYALHLSGQTATVAAAGEDGIVAGDVIRRTSSGGTIHEHRAFELVDGDGDPGTDPADGIYLAGIRFRVGELDRSLTGYLVFGTLLPTIDPLDAAIAWVEQNEELLAPDFGADADGDLDVDLSDLLAQQRGFGLTDADATQANGDADWNDVIDGADQAVWAAEFGSTVFGFAGAQSFSTGAVTTIPEPGAAALVFCGLWLLGGRRPSQSRG